MQVYIWSYHSYAYLDVALPYGKGKRSLTLETSVNFFLFSLALFENKNKRLQCILDESGPLIACWVSTSPRNRLETWRGVGTKRTTTKEQWIEVITIYPRCCFTMFSLANKENGYQLDAFVLLHAWNSKGSRTVMPPAYIYGGKKEIIPKYVFTIS